MVDDDLDLESRQVREVYAHFGLAVYWAQCLEQSIFQHLMFVDHFPKAKAAYTTPQKWAADFDAYEAREMSQTMGKLIRRLHEAGQPTKEVESLLERALRLRNWLAHSYFSDRAVELTLPFERKKMIAELEDARDKFRECSSKLDAITLPLLNAAGLTPERLKELEADIVAQYARPRPTA